MGSVTITVSFTCIEHMGVRIFRDKTSWRATGEIRAYNLPLQCEIQLCRKGVMIANAVAIAATRAGEGYTKFIHGRTPLVERDQKAEGTIVVPSVFLHDGLLLARAIRACNRRIHLGDVVTVTWSRSIGTSGVYSVESGLLEWCDAMTCIDAKEAAIEERTRLVREWITRHLGEDSADRFFERHGEKSPEEQLKYVRRLLAARERRRRNKRNR